MYKRQTVRARNVARDIWAGLKNVVGGEISEYTRLQAQAREQAISRMIDNAESLGADAVINVRITTSMIMQGCSEIMAYGTAVKLSLMNDSELIFSFVICLIIIECLIYLLIVFSSPKNKLSVIRECPIETSANSEMLSMKNLIFFRDKS